MKKAIYAGSFDMPTLGHYEVMKKAVKAFGRIIVVIADNPAKKNQYMFSVEARIKMIQDMGILIEHEINGDNCGALNLVSVEVLPSKKYLAKYAEERGIPFLIRGIRDQMDFKFENDLYRTNRRIAPNVETIYLMPDDAYSLTSSSWVKSLIGYIGWVDQIKDNVTPYVLEEIKKWYLKKRFLDAFSTYSRYSSENLQNVGEEVWIAIVSGYESKAYHNLDHILKMLEHFDFFFNDLKSRDLVYSIFMHDINVSENVSKQIANKYLYGKMNAYSIGVISKLIEATKHHTCEYETELEEIIVSLDLMVLSEPYDQYKIYNAGVFKEYLLASGKSFEEFCPIWIKGRSEFIKKFLDRKFIYPHATIRDYRPNSFNSFTLEDIARQNLKFELENIEGVGLSMSE